MKNKKLLVIWGLIASMLITTSVFAANTETGHKGNGIPRWSQTGVLAQSGSHDGWNENWKSWTGTHSDGKFWSGNYDNKWGMRWGNHDDKAWTGAITRTVVNISSGVQITETTSDTGALAKLNKKFTKEQADTNTNPLVIITRVQLSNGIQTTITSTDAATVTKIQTNGGNIEKIKGNNSEEKKVVSGETQKKKGPEKVSTKKKITKKTVVKKVIWKNKK